MSSSIPAQISDSPSEADTGINIGPESFALPREQLPPMAEPPLTRWLSRGMAWLLVSLGLAQLAVELAMLYVPSAPWLVGRPPRCVPTDL